MKKLLTLAGLLSIGLLAQAQTPYSFTANWNYTGSGGNIPGDSNGSVTTPHSPQPATAGSNFGSGVNGISFTGGNTGGADDYAYQAQSWRTATSLGGNAYVEFCLTAEAGTELVPGQTVSLTFDERRSNTGPLAFQVRASTSTTFNGSNDIGTAVTLPDDNNWRSQGPFAYTIPAAPANPTFVCFRIYGYSAEAGGGTWRFDNVAMSATNALPVRWQVFNAERAGEKIQLTWTTAAERNNAQFDIERGTDGRTFETIGQVRSAGDSEREQRYTFTDTRPAPGLNYYRLRQVDADGQWAYSPVRSVRFAPTAAVVLYPTVTRSTLRVHLDTALDHDANWQVLDLTGRPVAEGVFAAEQTDFSLPVDALPAAVYVLRMVVGTEVVTEVWRKE